MSKVNLSSVATNIEWIKGVVNKMEKHLLAMNGSIGKIKEVQLVHQGNLDKHCLRIKSLEKDKKEEEIEDKQNNKSSKKVAKEFIAGLSIGVILYILTLFF